MPALKRCPRCGGSMFLYGYLDGWLEECLQCSYSCETQKVVSRLGNIPTNEEGEPAHVGVVGSHASVSAKDGLKSRGKS